MKTQENWSDNPDLFQAVSEKLEGLEVFDGEADHYTDAEVVAREEEDGYGDNSYIRITTNEGTFALGLFRIH